MNDLTTDIINTSVELLEKQKEFEDLFSRLRFLLARAGNDVRAAQLQAERETLEVFTEKEASKKLRISQATLSRLRIKLHLPHVPIGAQIMYTNKHLVQIVEILEKKNRRGLKAA